MTIVDLFHAFVALHIACGAVGLASFWVPVVARKGGPAHRAWGRVFTLSMLVTGSAAMVVATCTLLAPLQTHPQLAGHPYFGEPAHIRAVFGWMMLGLALLTVNLAWYGWRTVLFRQQRAPQREWRNLGLQAALIALALACAWQAWAIGQPWLLGMTVLGLATAATNLWFLYKPRPGRLDWLREHVKALVGAGISVYTAFFAFGAVRTVPALALHPGLWAIPLTVGLTLILVHWRRIGRGRVAAG